MPTPAVGVLPLAPQALLLALTLPLQEGGKYVQGVDTVDGQPTHSICCVPLLRPHVAILRGPSSAIGAPRNRTFLPAWQPCLHNSRRYFIHDPRR